MLAKTFDVGDWELSTYIYVKYDDLSLPVKITCGFDDGFWSDTDYIINVGGTASTYRGCGYVGNSYETRYTAWQEPTMESGLVSIKHRSEPVTYGAKISYKN